MTDTPEPAAWLYRSGDAEWAETHHEPGENPTPLYVVPGGMDAARERLIAQLVVWGQVSDRADATLAAVFRGEG